MLIRFDPFRELDRLTQQAWTGLAGREPAMPMDAFRRGDDFVLQFDLPGITPDSVEVTVEKNVLTVTAERAAPRREGDEVLAAERLYGRFSRQVMLGETLDSERICADYEHGVLTVTIPVAEQAKPRRIEVLATDRHKELVS